MPKITMYSFAGNHQPVQTTYSGLVTPAADGSVLVDLRDQSTMMREGYSVGASVNNLTATTDPTVASDSSAGYGPGSVWINTTVPRVWTCTSAALSAAVWTLSFQQA